MNLDHPALQRRLFAGGGDIDSGIRRQLGLVGGGILDLSARHLDAFRAMMRGLRRRTDAVDLRTTNSVPR